MVLSKDLYKMQWATDLSALANQARFGLKYFVKEKNSKQRSELLNNGIRLCDILAKGTKVGQEKSVLPKEIGYLNAIKPLIEASVNLKEASEDIDKVSRVLRSILENGKANQEEITSADDFFVKMSKIYQGVAFSTLNYLVEEKVFY